MPTENEKPTPVVAPAEVESNPLLSGLNSPVLGQHVWKVIGIAVAIAASIVGLQETSPELLAGLPPLVTKAAHLILALGTLAGIASPGIRQKQALPAPASVEAGKAAEAKPSDTLNK